MTVDESQNPAISTRFCDSEYVKRADDIMIAKNFVVLLINMHDEL